MEQISYIRRTNGERLPLHMGAINFGSSWCNELLLGIVASAQQHRAKDVNPEMQPDAFCLNVIAVSGSYGSDAFFLSSLGWKHYQPNFDTSMRDWIHNDSPVGLRTQTQPTLSRTSLRSRQWMSRT